MSSASACDHFQLHTWKKDTCANCLKPRKQHALDDAPQPAKRLSKVTITKDAAGKKDESQLSGDSVPEKPVLCVEESRREAKPSTDREIVKRQSTVGSPRPVPLKAKPSLVSNEDRSKKLVGSTDCLGRNVATKSLEKEKVSQEFQLDSSCENPKKVDILTNDSIQVGGKGVDESCLLESDKGSVSTPQKCVKLKGRPQAMPPQVPDPSKIPANRLKDREITKSAEKNKESVVSDVQSSSSSHYYQIYDISAKGLSGKPEPMEIPEEGKEEAVGAESAKAIRGCRAVELIDDQHNNTAMPYNVVDVTKCPLTKDQMISKIPPQLPSTPAPNRSSGVPSGVSNTLPSSKTSSMRDFAELLKSTAVSPKTLQKSVDQDATKFRTGESGGAPTSNHLSTGKTRISVEEKATNEDMNKDLYEDIGGCNRETDRQLLSSSVGNNPVACTSSLRSSAFEARLASVVKRDLDRAVSQCTLTSGIISTDDLKTEGSSVLDKQESPDIISTDSKFGESNTMSRQEKGRKSGGKSFFQKFLKRGNKEATAEQVPCRMSTGNITIEPILNVCTMDSDCAAPGQSPFGDTSPSHSAFKPFLPKDKVLLFPVNPCKKPLNEGKEPDIVPGLFSEEFRKYPVVEEGLSAEHCCELEMHKLGVALNDTERNLTEKSFSKVRDSQTVTVPQEVPLEKLLVKGGIHDNVDKENMKHMTDRQTTGAFGVIASVRNETSVESSPTMESGDRPFAALSSHRNSVHRDTKPCKAPRKVVAPPPVAPPPPPLPGSGGSKDLELSGTGCLSPTIADAGFVDSGQEQRSVSPLRLSSIGSEKPQETENSFMCHTLPRVSLPTSSAFSNSTNAQSLAFIDLRQLDLATKNARNKTMSEGVRFEKVLIAATDVMSSITFTNGLPDYSPDTSCISSLYQNLPSTCSPRLTERASLVAQSAVASTMSSALVLLKQPYLAHHSNMLSVVVEGKKGKMDELSVSCDAVERRLSKFQNRALPDPPVSSEQTPRNRQEVTLDETGNLYEFVSQSDSTRSSTIEYEQMTYEDIDIYCSRRNQENNRKTSSMSSGQKNTTNSQVASQKQGTSSDLAFPGIVDPCSVGCSNYLEPVCGKEEREAKARSKDNWRPCPAPRTSHGTKAFSGGGGGGGEGGQEEVTMPYVNTQMMNDELPLSTNDGFNAMANLIVNVLYHLTDQLYSHYVTQFLRNRSDVILTDFELLDVKPEIAQATVVFFRAKHLILAPSGCILMVMRDDFLGSGLSLEPNHANIISPLLCFPLTANDLEIIGRISGESSPPVESGTVAVLLCDRLSTVDVHWGREHTTADSSAMRFEQSVCHCIVEVLNALLYLRDSGCSVLRLSDNDVLMARFSDACWHPFIKPSVMTFDVCTDLDSALLSDDIVRLLCLMLRVDPLIKVDRLESKIMSRTKYSRGLQRLVRILQQNTWEGLESGRNLLEFLLWGPSEEEAKLVAMTETRETSFRVWLEVARCRMTSELVLQANRNNLELANQAKFLCRATESSLLGVTKLLFE